MEPEDYAVTHQPLSAETLACFGATKPHRIRKVRKLTTKCAGANAEPAAFPVIATTHWEHVGGRIMYIADEAHHVKLGGRYDWEYTEHAEKAKPLSRFWWRRFRSDMHHCGHCAHWHAV